MKSFFLSLFSCCPLVQSGCAIVVNKTIALTGYMKVRFVLYIVTTALLKSFSLETNHLLFMKGTFKT